MKSVFTSVLMAATLITLSSFRTNDKAGTLSPDDMSGAIVIERPYFNSGPLCNGEFGSVHGTWQLVINTTIDANGGYHFINQWNIKASGTGNFGSTYLLNYSEPIQLYIAPGGFPATYTLASNFNIVGLGKAPNLQSRGVIHITVNAVDDVVVNFETETGFICRYNG